MSIRNAYKSLYQHQFFSLSAGVAASNVLSLIAIPFLARIYGAESFGIFAIFYALTAILGMFSTLRLDLALPIITDDEERTAVSRLALACAAVGSVFFVVVWTIVPIRQWLHSPLDHTFGIATAGAGFLLATLNVQTQLAIKGGHIKFLSLRYLGEKVTTLAASFAFAKMTVYGLVLAQICGYLMSAIILTVGTKALLFRNFRIPWSTATHLLRKYRDFPLHNGIGIFFQMLTAQVPTLLFSALFPLHVLGFYNLAQRIIDAPNTIVGSSLGTVFYRRLLSAKRSELHRIYIRTMQWAGLVLLFPMLILAIFSKPIVTLAFGPQWEGAAILLSLLLPAAFFRMLFLVGQNCLVVLRRLNFGLGVAVASFVTTLLGIGLGYALYGTIEAAVCLSNIGAAISFAYGLYLIKRELLKETPGPA